MQPPTLWQRQGRRASASLYSPRASRPGPRQRTPAGQPRRGRPTARPLPPLGGPRVPRGDAELHRLLGRRHLRLVRRLRAAGRLRGRDPGRGHHRPPRRARDRGPHPRRRRPRERRPRPPHRGQRPRGPLPGGQGLPPPRPQHRRGWRGRRHRLLRPRAALHRPVPGQPLVPHRRQGRRAQRGPHVHLRPGRVPRLRRHLGRRRGRRALRPADRAGRGRLLRRIPADSPRRPQRDPPRLALRGLRPGGGGRPRRDGAPDRRRAAARADPPLLAELGGHRRPRRRGAPGAAARALRPQPAHRPHPLRPRRGGDRLHRPGHPRARPRHLLLRVAAGRRPHHRRPRRRRLSPAAARVPRVLRRPPRRRPGPPPPQVRARRRAGLLLASLVQRRRGPGPHPGGRDRPRPLGSRRAPPARR